MRARWKRVVWILAGIVAAVLAAGVVVIGPRNVIGLAKRFPDAHAELQGGGL